MSTKGSQSKHLLLFSITLREKDVCGNSKGGVQRYWTHDWNSIYLKIRLLFATGNLFRPASSALQFPIFQRTFFTSNEEAFGDRVRIPLSD